MFSTLFRVFWRFHFLFICQLNEHANVLDIYSKAKLEIFNKLGDSTSDSRIFSDNEIDDVAMVDVIMNDDSDEEEEISVGNNG